MEIQPSLAACARANVLHNGVERRCGIDEMDARRLSGSVPRGHFQRLVANPPYRSPQSGRVSPEPQRARARQELTLTLRDLVSIAAALLGDGGAFDLVHLTQRLPEVLLALSTHGLEPKALRLVSSFRESPPELFLVSARRGGRPGLKTQAPLFIYSSRGRYSPEMARILSPSFWRPPSP